MKDAEIESWKKIRNVQMEVREAMISYHECRPYPKLMNLSSAVDRYGPFDEASLSSVLVDGVSMLDESLLEDRIKRKGLN